MKKKVFIQNLHLAEDNKIMPEFHSVNWDKKLSVISKFKDERLKYFGKKLLYMEKPELLSKEDYNFNSQRYC